MSSLNFRLVSALTKKKVLQLISDLLSTRIKIKTIAITVAIKQQHRLLMKMNYWKHTTDKLNFKSLPALS